jgi:hypothetical protein
LAFATSIVSTPSSVCVSSDSWLLEQAERNKQSRKEENSDFMGN